MLTPGTKIGVYEIIGSLGAGGMGEVYRARDKRLGREVAIKALPQTVSANPEALARFEREAQALAALSHPNILTLHDVGTSEGITYAVMELLEGETLRARLASGALPQRKAIDIGAQTARGLAAAHDRHIAHRDLKPENIMIAPDGRAKILDFGLARQTSLQSAAPPDTPTLPGTEPGVVLGTVGYMAPEQVRGETSDHRADIFALGCVLYEMLTGRRPFQRDTAAETMTAIMKDDPPEPSGSGVVLSPAVQRILRRCLEKRPDERFQSTRDLVFALESSLESSTAAVSVVTTTEPASRRRPHTVALVAGALAIGAIGGIALTVFLRPAPVAMTSPTFRQLTFERGTIRDARFTPDGQSVVYGAAWEGNPLRVFMTRIDAVESTRLSLPDARLLSISRGGEMALSLGHRYEGWIGLGTLARSTVLGSAPRVLAENIREAEWAPDGSALAIVRSAGGLEQIEFPIGRVIYKTSGFISSIRFSPSGDRLAFADHPVFADDAGGVSVVTLDGQRTVLATDHISVRGVAWSRDGREVWYSAREGGENSRDSVYAATMTGSRRVVWSSPSSIKLFDIAADGGLLLGNEVVDRRVEALMGDATSPVDVSLRTHSSSNWISPDGSAITIADQNTSTYTAYLHKAGSPPVALGDGQPFGMSPDGRWVLAVPVSGSPLLLHPTGAGESRALPNPEKLVFDTTAWLPDGRHVVMFGQASGQAARGYVQDVTAGDPRPFTPVGVSSLRWWAPPVSPDGRRVIARTVEGVATIYSIASGAAEVVPGVTADELPLQWVTEHELLVARGNGLPWIVDRLNMSTGRRTRAFEIRPRDVSGLRLSVIGLSAGGRHYVHSFSRLLTELFLVRGLS